MKYISKYFQDKKVTPAQFITEMICERKAKKDGNDLHHRFWLSDKWNKYFRNQIPTANKLCKQFSARAIINALNTTAGLRIFSLRAPHLVPIIEQEEVKLAAQNTEMRKEVDRSEKKTFTKHKTKQNIISKLRELD
jgi:hypothetical protein